MNRYFSNISQIITAEANRQRTQINLIPSENYTSKAVREAVGSVLMHKYSEGNVSKRYYEGNNFIDQLEQLTIDRAKELFRLPEDWDVNVQALSGSNANLAALLAVLEPGDKILSMHLPDGGHLSHGWKTHVVAKLFDVVQYKTNPETQLLDYDELQKLAAEHRPQMIITGGTAYPRNIDYSKVKQIAESVGAMYLADIAHEAGLVAAGVLPSPVGIADVVTLTTHKTLRAARGALILAGQGTIKKVNRAVLPGLQGGPFNNNIAGICVGLEEALRPEFKNYAQQVLTNAQALAHALQKHGFNLVSGGTDKHLILIDLQNRNVTGKQAASALAKVGIIANMNTIPGETRPPSDPSGLRLGTPFVTTQGMQSEHMQEIADWINQVLSDLEGDHHKIAQEVTALMQALDVQSA